MTTSGSVIALALSRSVMVQWAQPSAQSHSYSGRRERGGGGKGEGRASKGSVQSTKERRFRAYQGTPPLFLLPMSTDGDKRPRPSRGRAADSILDRHRQKSLPAETMMRRTPPTQERHSRAAT